jgi:hypothetical protein
VGSIVMPAISYLEEHQLETQAKVRSRYAGVVDTLSRHGFRELCFYREQFGLFSTILGLPMSVLMLFKREVLKLNKGLQVSAAFVLMYHRSPATVVVPLGLGVKFYTAFHDRTLLISTNFPSCVGPDSSSSIVKYGSKMTVDEAWTRHQQRVRELESQGKTVSELLSFSQYVEMSRQEEGTFS